MAVSCQDIQEEMLISESLSSARLDQAQRTHLEGCEACQLLWSSHRAALAAGTILRTKRLAASPANTDAFMARLDARRGKEARPAERGWSGLLWAVAGVAAAVALLVWFQSSTGLPPVQRSPAVAHRAPAPRPTLQTPDELALQKLMTQAFASVSQTTRLDRPDSIEERFVEALGDDLEEDARHDVALATGPVRGFQVFDPAPISQKAPAPLSSISTLVGMVMRREL